MTDIDTSQIEAEIIQKEAKVETPKIRRKKEPISFGSKKTKQAIKTLKANKKFVISSLKSKLKRKLTSQEISDIKKALLDDFNKES